MVRRGCSKITFGDVLTRVSLRSSRHSLAFYYGKVPSFITLHYVSISLLFASHFNVVFSLFEQFEHNVLNHKNPFEDNCFFVIYAENLNDLNTYCTRQSYFIDRSEKPEIRNLCIY